MLHENPSMLDIDVNHWRNLQSLLLESAKARRRIIVIHDRGEIQKFVHSHREPIARNVSRVEDPRAVAEQVYRDNLGRADFVSVLERSGFDEYVGRFQATWRADEDLDDFVHRTYALMDEYPDAIVTYPGPARQVLGLQWRIGAYHGDVCAAVKEYVPRNSTVVFGVFDGDDLWTTLVLGFDADLRINVVTTVDPSQLAAADTRSEIASEVVRWVDRQYGPCSLGLFTSLESAHAFLESEAKLAFLQALADKGDLIANPVPDTLPLQRLATSR